MSPTDTLRSSLAGLAIALAAGCATSPGTTRAEATAPTAQAASPVAEPARRLATRPQPVLPMLWRIADGDNKVYLLGSFHLLKPEDLPLPRDVEDAFADAEAVWFEIDPRQMQDTTAMAATFMQAARYDKPGDTLTKVLPEATRTRLERFLAASGGSLAAMDQSEPWAVNTAIILGVAQAMGFRQENGVDAHLMQRTAQAGKRSGGLETVAAQMTAMDRAPHAEQIAALDEFLLDPPKTAAELTSLHEWWKAGDLGNLERELVTEMQRKAPVTHRLMLTARHDAWMPQLERLLSAPGRDDYLVVVGAAHLLGKDGLVERLRARGHAIERICSDCAPGTPDVRH